MQWGNPFSFKGRVGRAQLWLTMVVFSILQFPMMLFPVKSHHVVLSTFGGWGESYVDYATPIEPVTTQSWALLAAFYVIVALFFWIVFATMVQRLHDLGRSGKWLLAVVGGLAITLVLEAMFSRPGQPISILEIADTIFMAPFCFIGALGMFLMFFVRGDAPSQYDALSDSDIRRSAS